MERPSAKCTAWILLACCAVLILATKLRSTASFCNDSGCLAEPQSQAAPQTKSPSASGPQEVPEWAQRDFDSPAPQVYAAALKSIQLQKHEVQSQDESAYTVDFHVGMTALSRGYNMRLVVNPAGENRSSVTVGVLRSGGKVFSWGSGKKEVAKIFAGVEAELAAAKTSPQEPPSAAPKAEKAEGGSPCVLEVRSIPSAADVELDGKFVGNTPTTLRLKPGEYTVTLRKTGFAPWTRKLSAIPDNTLRINAELRKNP